MHDSSETSSSSVKVFGNIFISFIGAGVLGLPYAFKEAGILEGVVIMSLAGYLSVCAMLLLIDCKDFIVKNKLTGDKSVAYKRLQEDESARSLIGNGKTADGTVEFQIENSKDDTDVGYGDVGFVAYGRVGSGLVDLAIVVSQTGFCCAYLIFISENLIDYLHVTDDEDGDDDVTAVTYQQRTLVMGMLLPLCLLCFLRKLDKLAIFSLAADFANIFAYSIVFWFDFEHAHKVSIHPKEMDLNGFPFFAGMAVYCYEGAGMILSLEGSMEKSVRHKFRSIFKFAMLMITTLYIVFGVCGYMSFGPDTNQIITINLPPGVFPMLVKLFLCFSLFFTYPVMMFPVIQILQKKCRRAADNYVIGNILRGMMVLVTGVVVTLIPSFSTLMLLIGACICSPLAFILPALFHLKIFRNSLSRSKRMMDYLLIAVGIFASTIGSIDAFKRIGLVTSLPSSPVVDDVITASAGNATNL